jgi:hypothetical protein
MSERLAWALDVGVAPPPVSSQQKGHSVVEAGTDRAGWAKDGFALIAELRDAMHGVADPDSLPETPSDRWEAEGQYLESLAVSKRRLPSLAAWLEDHPDAGTKLARRAPEPVEGGS